MEIKKCKSNGCNNNKPDRGFYCGKCRNSKQRYGLSVPEREEILANQHGQCLICENEIKFDGSRSQYSACVDHNHKTGKVRGILCGNCNTWIGYLENKNISLDVLKRHLD